MPDKKSRKTPRRAASPRPQKKPVSIVRDPDVIKHDPISWGLRWTDLGGDWSWRKLNPDHMESLHRQLVAMEGETLHKLIQDRRVKDIPVEHIEREPQERLKTIRLEEAETLWELRLGSKWRVWGLVERATFYFLWWDENETVCGPPPKGTRRR